MKCPNCGEIIPEGNVYCEACGAELQIVPELEYDDISIESEMKQTMSDLAINEFAKDYDIDFDDDPNIISMLIGKHKTGKAFYIILAVVVTAIIVAAVILGKRITVQNSYEYQIELAEERIASNNIVGAIEALEKAYKIEPSVDLLFKIADFYYTLGRDNDAIFTLSEITNGSFPAEDIEAAYRKIISLYVNAKNYTMIANLLQNCTNTNILNDFADYMVFTPSFNVEEGTYKETVMLKLSADGPGNIYFTTDNNNPTENSSLFTTPIFLEYGSYTVKAVYINKYGVSSEVVSAKYLIDVDFVFEPNIITEAGTYTTATLIEAEVPILYTLYYTTDGSDPSKESTRYTAPIPMKEGETTYRFICYASDGTQSTIVERTYVLQLEAEYTPAEAVSALAQRLIETSYLIDGEHKEGYAGTFQLMYSAIYPIEDMGNFYFVVEYYTDEQGNQSVTNKIFAVNCNDLSIYTVKTMGSGNYSLTAY